MNSYGILVSNVNTGTSAMEKETFPSIAAAEKAVIDIVKWEENVYEIVELCIVEQGETDEAVANGGW